MRRFVLGLTLFAATIPLDLACSKDDGDETNGLGDGDGDGDISLGGEGGDGDGDGDAPVCASFAGLPQCDQEGSTAKKVETNLLLVIDKSGSMDDTGGFETTKWQVMHQALNQALNEVRYEINVGLALYPRTGNPLMEIDKDLCGDVGNCCSMPDDTDPNILVGPGADTVPLIIEEISDVDPSGGTPTAVALAHAYDYYVNGPGKDLEGEKFVVLATDGGPNCNSGLTCNADACTLNIEERTVGATTCTTEGNTCCTGSSGVLACLDDEATRDAVSTLATAGIDTFVIGVPGSEFYADLLDAVAEEGGRALAGDRKYFQVDGADGVDALTDVFRAITKDLVTSCEIALSEDSKSLIDVNVAVDCEIVPQTSEGSGNGGAGGAGNSLNWEVDLVNDPPLVRLLGETCDKVEAGVERVDVILGCPPVL